MLGFFVLGRGTSCVLSGASPNMSDECTDPCTAQVRFRLLRNGTWDTQGGGGSGGWISSPCQTATVGDSYEAEFVVDTGDGPTSTSSSPTGAGNWYTISSTLDWTWTTSVAGGLDGTATVTVREIADTGNSVTFSLTAHTLVE
jgi:hypothetical protein